MDSSSSPRNSEEANKEDGTPMVGELDLNLLENRDEQRANNFQYENEALDDRLPVDANPENATSHELPHAVSNEGLQSPIMQANLVSPSPLSRKVGDTCSPIDSELQHDDVEGKISDYAPEGLRSTIEDYADHSQEKGANYIGLSGELVGSSTNEALNEEEPGDLDPYFQKLIKSNDDRNDNDSFVQMNNTGDSNYRTMLDGDFGKKLENTEYGKAEVEDEEMDGGNFNHNAKMKDDDQALGLGAPDNGSMEKESSVWDSPLKAQNGTPSPERHLPVSEERSPPKESYGKQELLSPENGDRKSVPTPSSSRRKDSLSPQNQSRGHKRASSRDRLSPPVRRKTPSGRTHRDSHHRDSPPRKRSSASPPRRESPRRRDRSPSRSPARRRDSSRHRRDHRGRSRSRSPYSRDRYRRSPRRSSPRRRSPPPSYYSRRRSPRRPWSPPANRSTGVGRPGRNLFVAGFSYVTTERDLEKKFSRFGRVTDVRIVRDKRSGDSRGFGFLSLERDEDADAAIRALDQTEWNGRIVLVEKSKTSAR